MYWIAGTFCWPYLILIVKANVGNMVISWLTYSSIAYPSLPPFPCRTIKVCIQKLKLFWWHSRRKDKTERERFHLENKVSCCLTLPPFKAFHWEDCLIDFGGRVSLIEVQFIHNKFTSFNYIIQWVWTTINL